MTATTFSLIAVVASFSLLVAYVYWPGNKTRLEAQGRIPLEDEGDEQ